MLNDATIKKFTDIAITSHGTSGVEFPAYGIPSICVEDSFFTDIGCSTKAKNLINNKSDLRRLFNQISNNRRLQLSGVLFLMILCSFAEHNKSDLFSYLFHSLFYPC